MPVKGSFIHLTAPALMHGADGKPVKMSQLASHWYTRLCRPILLRHVVALSNGRSSALGKCCFLWYLGKTFRAIVSRSHHSSIYIYTLGFGLFSCYSQPTTNLRSRYMRYSKYSITEAIETSGPSPHDRILLSAINTQSCSQFHAAYLLKLSIELSHQMPVRLGRWQGKYKQGEQRNPAYLPGQQMANPKSLP